MARRKGQFRFKPSLAQPWSVNSRVGVLVGARNRYLMVKWQRCRTEPLERRVTYDTEKSKTEFSKLWTSPESRIDQNNDKFPDWSCITKQLGNSQQNAHHFPTVGSWSTHASYWYLWSQVGRASAVNLRVKMPWMMPWMTITFVHSSME